MAYRIRHVDAPGMTLNFSIERLDGTFWDFAASGTTAQTFCAAPITMLAPLPASNGASSIYAAGAQANLNGSYDYTIPTASLPVAQFTNGSYATRVCNASNSNQVLGVYANALYNQDDEPVYTSGTAPTVGQIATAIWTDVVSGDFATPGSPGYILIQNINAAITSRLAASAYVASPTVAQIATGVLTDTASADLSTAGSIGYIANHQPSWYVGGGGGGGGAGAGGAGGPNGPVGNLVPIMTPLGASKSIGAFAPPAAVRSQIFASILTGSGVSATAGVSVNAYPTGAGTTIAAATSAGATSVTVANASGISTGQMIAILSPVTGVGEIVTVSAIASDVLTISATQYAYAANASVYQIAQVAAASTTIAAPVATTATSAAYSSYTNILNLTNVDYWINFTNLDATYPVNLWASRNL